MNFRLEAGWQQTKLFQGELNSMNNERTRQNDENQSTKQRSEENFGRGERRDMSSADRGQNFGTGSRGETFDREQNSRTFGGVTSAQGYDRPAPKTSFGESGRRDFQDRGANFRTGSSGKGHEGFMPNLPSGLWAALIGLGAGITAMYFMDPDRGRRRRALLSDKLMSAGSGLPNAVRVSATDISNRAAGAWASASRLFSSDDPSDQVLEARIRSKMGRVISHPHAVHVNARNGRITLDGVILAHELPHLLSTVESVSGVQDVENRLRVHDTPGNIPSLQGGRERTGEQWELLQQNWSPAAKIGAGAIGLGLSAVGATLLARTFTSSSGGGRTAITIDKSINVKAPVDVLFGLWSNFENFPKFMSNVLEVKNLDDKRSRWTVAGPAGVPVQWDAEVTKIIPNEMIAWRSIEGSTVDNAGYVLFEPNDDGSTEVNVRLTYNPPAGAIGHAVAKAFGADPKSEMDQDLMRLKTLVETGNASRDASQGFTSPKGNRVH
jgi:uncharacterized membrane protein